MLKSLIRSAEVAQEKFTAIKFNIIVTDTNSSKEDIAIMKQLLSNTKIESRLSLIDLKSFENKMVLQPCLVFNDISLKLCADPINLKLALNERALKFLLNADM